MDNRNIWKNYVIVTRVKLSVESDVLVIHLIPIIITLFQDAAAALSSYK